MPYAYAAAFHCDKCGRAIRKELKAAGKHDTGDSDDWPQYVNLDDEATDGPEHCDSGPECLAAEELDDGRKLGAWLGNDLTPHGVAYVASVAGPVGDWWRDQYGIPSIVRRTPPRVGPRAKRPGFPRGRIWFCGVDVERAQRRLARMGW